MSELSQERGVGPTLSSSLCQAVSSSDPDSLDASKYKTVGSEVLQLEMGFPEIGAVGGLFLIYAQQVPEFSFRCCLEVEYMQRL